MPSAIFQFKAREKNKIGDKTFNKYNTTEYVHTNSIPKILYETKPDVIAACEAFDDKRPTGIVVGSFVKRRHKAPRDKCRKKKFSKIFSKKKTCHELDRFVQYLHTDFPLT